MANTDTSKKGRKSQSSKSTHWRDLPRDSQGRWMKRRKQKAPARPQKKVVPEQVPSRAYSKPKIDPTASHSMSLCPRCGGDMKQHRIRCGPERLVSVRKCEICNYWVPIPEQVVPPIKA